MNQRIQKIIAHAGICSRRKAEELIVAEKVTVNGRIATLGESADPEKDTLCVDGKPIHTEKKVYYLLHKPKEIVVTRSDPQGRKTVYDLPSVSAIPERVMAVGRLDSMTEGALLLTNDGDFANKIMHPRYETKKLYYVRVEPAFNEYDVTQLRKGIVIDGKRTTPERVEMLSPNEIVITIHEGRNRIVRKIMAHLGYKVFQLKRIGIGNLLLGTLAVGEIRRLSTKEVSALNVKEPQKRAI